MNALPSDPIRAEHRDLVPHLGHVASAASQVTTWDAATAGRVLPRIVGFLRDSLLPHARAEEDVLYPAIDRILGAPVTATMVVDHTDIADRVDALATAVEDALRDWGDGEVAADLSRQLAAIAAIVDLHFRKEEEVLLPVLDTHLSVEEGRELFEWLGHGAHTHEHA